MAGILWDTKDNQILNGVDGVEATGVYKGVLKEDMIDTVCRVRRPFINVFIEKLFFEEGDWPLTYVPMHNLVLSLKKDQEVWVRFDQHNLRYPVLHKLVDHLDAKETDEYIMREEPHDDDSTPPPELPDASQNILQVDGTGKVGFGVNAEAEKDYNKDKVLVNETEESPDPNDEGEDGILVRFPDAVQTKEVIKISDDYWVITTDDYCLVHRGAQGFLITKDSYMVRADNIASLATVSEKHEVQGTYNEHIHGPVSRVYDDTYNEHIYGAVTRKYEEAVEDTFVSDWNQTWEADVTRTYQGKLTEEVAGEVSQTYSDKWMMSVTGKVDHAFDDEYALSVMKKIGIESTTGKISIKNGAAGLFADVLDKMLGALLKAPTTVGSPATQNFNPAITLDLVMAKAMLGVLME